MGHGAKSSDTVDLLGVQGDRFELVPWRQANSAALHALFAPEVVAWLPPGFQAATDHAQRLTFLAQLEQQAQVAALKTPEGGICGLVLLGHPEGPDFECHLGYLFAKTVWGQGLASALLQALTRYCSAYPVTLIGGVMADNAGSIKVLERAGFCGQEPDGDERFYRWRSPALTRS